MTSVAIRPDAVVHPAPVAAPRPTDPRDPMVRLAALCDPGSTVPLREPDRSGVVAVEGRIDGARVVAYCTDAAISGGAMGAAGCRVIVEAIETAVRLCAPVVGLWHSGGARLPEGVQALDGVGRVFAAMVRASGRVPQVSVVLGPAAGGAAYGPALTDLVVMAPTGRVFVTGPDVIRSVTGAEVTQEALGGPAAHATRSGVAHVIASSEADALAQARASVGLLARPGAFDAGAVADPVDLRALLPARSRQAYDVGPLVRALADPGSFLELQPGWATSMVVGLGRLGGRTVGLLANNPMRMAGCLDSASAEKAARFVRLCDAFGVPLVAVVDVPGYLPGVEQEWDGIVRRGAKLLHAFAESVVPRVTLVTHKAFGGAYIAMNSRSLGATAVFAWPEAEVAVMGASAAVEILHRRVLASAPAGRRDALRARLAAEHERESGGVARAVELGVVDEIIDPRHTRARLLEALAGAEAGRGVHNNIPL
jgi:acetyl-CoA/propionyl-CoA carboxylase carboxyl transferase subunit